MDTIDLYQNMKQYEIVGLPIGHNDPLYWSRNRQDFITAREDDGTKGCQFETKEEAEKELIKAQKEWRKYNNEKSCAISEIEVVV